MRVILQRVSTATVEVVGVADATASIGTGWLALVGVAVGDTLADADHLAGRVMHLRAFADDDGKMNRSVLDIRGEILVVSNFTLAADCRQGRRPGFATAMPPGEALPLFERFVTALRAGGVPVGTGRFGADMRINLTNNGPVTFVLDAPEKIL